MGLWVGTLPSLTGLAVVALFLLASGSAADELKTVTSVDGRCEKLILPEQDRSTECDGKILQTTYASGRSGFYVGIAGGAVTFSGMSQSQPDDAVQLQSVDRVFLNFGTDKTRPAARPVTGSCGYTNLFAGGSTVNCTAIDEGGGAYLLQFTTDGVTPRISKLGAEEQADPALQTLDGYFAVGPWEGHAYHGGELAYETGCLMSTMVDDNWGIFAHAGDEFFALSIFNENWHFPPDAKVRGELLFDGVAYPDLGIEVRNEHVLMLQSTLETYDPEVNSYLPLFEAATSLTFRIGNEELTATLRETAKATEALFRCAYPGYDTYAGTRESQPEHRTEPSLTINDAELVMLRGRLGMMTAPAAETASEKPERYPALVLDAPIDFVCDGADPGCEPESDQRVLHLVLDEQQWATFDRRQGEIAEVEGTPFHAISGHHHTRVLLSVTSLRFEGTTADLPSPEAAAGAYVVLASKQTEQAAKSSRNLIEGQMTAYLAGRPLQIRDFDNGTLGTWYRVVLPLENLQEATKACSAFVAHGIDCIPVASAR